MSREERNRLARERQRAKRAADPEKANRLHREYIASKTPSWRARRSKRYDTAERRAKQRQSDLKRKYKLTAEQYGQLLDFQSGVCAICLVPDPSKGAPRQRKTFDVDHCHSTGRVRGLLCSRCNIGIGRFGDSVDLLQRAADYLRRSA